jgi:WD40 repeat protein
VQDGQSLLVGSSDGSVRIWDIAAGQVRATLWRGEDTIQSGSWFDATTKSVWVVARDELIQLSLDPSTLVARACSFVGRTLTQGEWDRFVPGGGEVQPVCQ